MQQGRLAHSLRYGTVLRNEVHCSEGINGADAFVRSKHNTEGAFDATAKPVLTKLLSAATDVPPVNATCMHRCSGAGCRFQFDEFCTGLHEVNQRIVPFKSSITQLGSISSHVSYPLCLLQLHTAEGLRKRRRILRIPSWLLSPSRLQGSCTEVV